MIIRIRRIISLFLLSVPLLAFAASNNDVQQLDHKALQTLAHNFVSSQIIAPENGRIEVVANNLDPRMVAKACRGEPRVEFASNSGLDNYTTVEIQCDAPQAWRTYVPVRIYRYKPVITAAIPMSPGHLISEADLTMTEIDINRIRSNVFTEKDALIGARVKKRVRSGQAIEASDTCLVCSGEKVTIVAKSKALQITATGKALADGLQGESVTVENTRSNKALEAIVTGLNEVTVNL